jgi:DnaJ-class molecular chaperone
MKTIKQYPTGCSWCNATGMVRELYPTTTGGWSQVCPVCNGSKIVIVTETITDESTG